jgi:hypothetical protein
LNVADPINADIACQGKLFYDPTTNASLFFPVAGLRDPSTGMLRSTGSYVNYWTSTSNGASQAWMLNLYNANAYQGAANKSNGFLLRCVVQPCVPVTSVSITASGSTTIPVGNSVTLSVTAPVAGVTYQWERSFDGGTTWIPLNGAIGNTFSALAALNGEIRYRAVAINSCSTVASNAIGVT